MEPEDGVGASSRRCCAAIGDLVGSRESLQQLASGGHDQSLGATASATLQSKAIASALSACTCMQQRPLSAAVRFLCCPLCARSGACVRFSWATAIWTFSTKKLRHGAELMAGTTQRCSRQREGGHAMFAGSAVDLTCFPHCGRSQPWDQRVPASQGGPA